MCLAAESASSNPANALCRPGKHAWKVAFASGDGVHVDQHFGSSRGFALFEVATDGMVLPAGHLPMATVSDHDGRLDQVLEGISGCRLVYCVQVGPAAIQRLLRAGIQPVRVEEGAVIAGLLEEVRTRLGRQEPCRGHRDHAPAAPEGCERFVAWMKEEHWELD